MFFSFLNLALCCCCPFFPFTVLVNSSSRSHSTDGNQITALLISSVAKQYLAYLTYHHLNFSSITTTTTTLYLVYPFSSLHIHQLKRLFCLKHVGSTGDNGFIVFLQLIKLEIPDVFVFFGFTL